MPMRQRLQLASRDTVLKVLVILVSVSVLVNSIAIAGLVIERDQRQEADRLSVEDRTELRSRARTVECLIVNVLDPIVAESKRTGRPVSPDLIRELNRLRSPATVADANTRPCKPFIPPNP